MRLPTAFLLALCTGGYACGPGGEPAAPGPTPPVEGPGPAEGSPAAPEPHDPRLDQAIRAVAAGDYGGAQALARAVSEERPGSARAAFALGLAYHKQKNYLAARPHFDRALELGPTFEPYAPVHYFRAWCLWNCGDPDGARASFERHLELVPDEADSHFGLGVIALDQARLDDAERHLGRSLELAHAKVQAGNNRARSEAAKAHARLADVHLLRDDPARAREALETCVQLYPPHYTAWYKLHQVLIELELPDLATQALTQHDHWKAQVRPGSRGLGDGR